ncbi:hypothetical protein CLU79DRAFT_884029 [Phycomyces nitens]|nr:hypothetical protein CLU79DRAFT_884029 [Phycomyces nitens]
MTIDYPLDYKTEPSYIDFWKKTARLHANKVLVRYYSTDDDGSELYKTLTYEQVDRISTNLAFEWIQNLHNVTTVGFISDHSPFYLISMLAIMKLGVVFLSLSPRNSADSDASLLKATSTRFIITSKKYENIARGAANQIKGCRVFVYPDFDLDKLSKLPLISQTKFADNICAQTPESIILIGHSSGTTGFPKPISMSNRFMINVIQSLRIGINDTNPNIEYLSSDVILPCTPLFHSFSLFAVFNVFLVGASVVFMKQLPPSVQELVFAIKANKCTFMTVPPLILEQVLAYCKENNDFSPLQQLKLTIFGGAPLKQEVGSFCESSNIIIRNSYGATEIGSFMMGDLAPNTIHWNTLRPLLPLREYCIWETYFADPTLVHLVVKSGCPSLAQGVSNREDGTYATRDLFKETPPNSGYYSYYGRMDDTLIMKNGEKTNPLPIEATIRQCSLVSQCVVIGEDRQCVAVLIELPAETPREYTHINIMEIVYPYILEANKSAPTHSKIFKQMIYILPLKKSLPSTAKGTVIRKHAYNEYKEEIERLYTDFINGPQTCAAEDLKVGLSMSPKEIKLFLIKSAAEVLCIPQTDIEITTKSLFDFGLTSITSIQLRNKISRFFGTLSQNFLFQYPTIDQIVVALLPGTKSPSTWVDKSLSKTEEILDIYLKRASKDFEVAKSAYVPGQEQVVLLTGATGSLGSFMLCDLLKSPCVSKVYCLVRGKGSEAINRIYHAFESRNLDTSLLDTSKLVALPMNLQDEKLGFSQDFYAKLKSEVTIVQHCAWLLDFNHPVEHYEKECIQGLYNLVKFSYRQTNPIHLHFISSISASAGWGSVIPESPLPRNTKVAMPMGYAQSKYIVEHLFNYLTKEKKLPCIIERLGQVCGDSINGVWNTSEQYPLMFVGGGNIMKKMPNLNIIIDWIPVNYAASSIVDIMLKTSARPVQVNGSVYHIVNPYRVTWSYILQAMRDSGMTFETVEANEWVKELEKDDENPAFKLLSFYESSLDGSSKMPVLSIEKTAALTPILKDCPALSIQLFNLFVLYWKSIEFYKD